MPLSRLYPRVDLARTKGRMKCHAPAADKPLKICVVFDEDASGAEAEILISHVASDYECDVRWVQFDELAEPAYRTNLAHSASEADMLVVSLRDDNMLPSPVKSWLGLCLDMRADGQEGALIALVAHPLENPPPHSALLEYLEVLAMIGGLEYFERHALKGRP